MYEVILNEIEKYEALTNLEVQNQIKPIIKSWGAKYVSEQTNINISHIYWHCKKESLIKADKLDFDMYIKIMALGINPKKRIKE